MKGFIFDILSARQCQKTEAKCQPATKNVSREMAADCKRQVKTFSIYFPYAINCDFLYSVAFGSIRLASFPSAFHLTQNKSLRQRQSCAMHRKYNINSMVRWHELIWHLFNTSKGFHCLAFYWIFSCADVDRIPNEPFFLFSISSFYCHERRCRATKRLRLQNFLLR